jgi:LCP family protein required for cell wall assembly
MLFRKRFSATSAIEHPATQSGSYQSFRRRRFSKRTKIIFIFTAIVILSIPAVLLAKSIYAYKSILQRHTGVSSQVLSDKNGQFESKSEAEGRVNILLIGVGDAGHAGATLADTLIVASIDPESKDVAMLSLPRDLYVPIPNFGKDKINSSHAYGELKRSGEGPNLAKEVVSKVLDVPIHNYIRVDFTGFKKSVDVLGGISMNVEQSLSDSSYPCDKDERLACGFSIKAGTQTMNGAIALKYARCRKGNCGNDYGRAARQQAVLLKMREKALEMSTLTNPAKLAGIIDTVGEHVRTDFNNDEINRLAAILRDIKSDSVRSKVVDGETEKLVMGDNIGGASVVIPTEGDGQFGRIQDFAHSLFVDRHLVDENVPITIIDATGRPNSTESVASLLKGYHYNIVDVRKAEKQSQTEIIDTTNGKAKYTRRYLESRYGVNAREENSSSTGITLILGSQIKIEDR